MTDPIDIKALLIIEPGTRLELDHDAGLYVEGTGRIEASRRHANPAAAGFDQDKIILTSTVEDPGWWRGVTIDSPHSGNFMKHGTH